MAVQDDERERQMVLLFNLTVPDDRGRSDIDAYLDTPDSTDPLPFELKSTTKNSISTVRDFGPEHISKWRNLHWLFAFYEPGGQGLRYCYYASPADMAQWIAEKETYVRPDLVLAEFAPRLVTDDTLSEVMGEGDSFSLREARLIMKKQWTADRYDSESDMPGNRFSRAKMIELLKHRCAYVIRRGATLNNPHIQERYFSDQGLSRIEKDHASTLRVLVRDYLQSEAGPAPIDPLVAGQASASRTDDATA